MGQTNHKLILDVINNTIAESKLVYNESGTFKDHKYMYVNNHFCISFGVTSKECTVKGVRRFIGNSLSSLHQNLNQPHSTLLRPF